MWNNHSKIFIDIQRYSVYCFRLGCARPPNAWMTVCSQALVEVSALFDNLRVFPCLPLIYSHSGSKPSVCKKLALTRWKPVPMKVLPITSAHEKQYKQHWCIASISLGQIILRHRIKHQELGRWAQPRPGYRVRGVYNARNYLTHLMSEAQAALPLRLWPSDSWGQETHRPVDWPRVWTWTIQSRVDSSGVSDLFQSQCLKTNIPRT